jgi:succinate dehydrogenase / fumarate reductase iron-sulfur subunit
VKSTFLIQRYVPEVDAAPHMERYELDLWDEATILDGLLAIKDRQDDSLAFRRACRHAICGSCAMVVNGYSKLVCKVSIAAELKRGRKELRITPMRTMRVMKDLVVDMAPFWKHFRDLEPWLQPDPRKVPAADEEYRVRPEQLVASRKDLNCVQCGVCVSDCGVAEVDSHFAGPAALAKAHRFVTDPRDSKRKERLQALIDAGLWDCAHAYNCMECPKHVDPAMAIADLRRISVEAGLTDNVGARHSRVFTKSVGRTGRLDESMLVLQTVGITNIPGQIRNGPQGLRMLMKGKLPLPMVQQERVDNPKEVRKIYETVGTGEER